MENPYVADFNDHADFGVAYGRTFIHQDDVGAPITNVGQSGLFYVRQDFGQPVLLTGTCTLGGANGVVAVSISDTAMRTIASAKSAAWQGVYDLVLVGSGSSLIKLVKGTFTIHPTSSVTP